MDIDKNSVLKINDVDFLASQLGEEIIILDMKSGDYIGLNKVGSAVWKLIDEPTTLDEIIQSLLTSYDIDEEQCRSEVTTFLTGMVEKNAILVQ